MNELCVLRVKKETCPRCEKEIEVPQGLIIGDCFDMGARHTFTPCAVMMSLEKGKYKTVSANKKVKKSSKKRKPVSFDEYVAHLIRLNPRKKSLILEETVITRRYHEKDFAELERRNLAKYAVGLYLNSLLLIDF